jgi:hypothetical protein
MKSDPTDAAAFNLGNMCSEHLLVMSKPKLGAMFNLALFCNEKTDT